MAPRTCQNGYYPKKRDMKYQALARCGGEGMLVHCWWGCKLVQPLRKNSMEGPQKIKNRTTVWSSNSTSRCLSKENEDTDLKDTCTPMFTAALFTIAKTWKIPKCPLTDEWIKTCVCVCVCVMEYYSAIRGNEILPFVEGQQPGRTLSSWC